jgi:hypothetical protein
MNILICGMPGNGKGVKAMQLMCDELRLGTRPVVTNLAVMKLPWVAARHQSRIGLISYLDSKHGDDFNCRERIFKVQDHAIQNYYLYRSLSKKQIEKLGAAHLVGYRAVTPLDDILSEEEFFLHKDYQLFVCDHDVKVDKSGRGHCSKFNPILLEHSGPHFNIADECWKFWPARGWQSTSDADVYYNAQHRHFGDDNLYLTQRENDIDSIIVDRCQESIVMTHHGKMRIGMFRQPDLFSEAIFNGRPSPSKDPMSRRVFRLDVKGLCQGYDTSAGVGITGRGSADIGSRKSGLPFWIMPVLILVGLFAVGLIFTKGAKFVSGILTGKHTTVASNVVKKITGSAAGPAVDQPVPVSRVSRVLPDEPLVDTNQIEPVVCVGYILGKYPIVYLSDGRVAEAQFGEVQGITRRMVFCFGEKFPMVLKPRGGTLPEQPVFQRNDVPQNPFLASVPGYSGNPVQVTGTIHGQGGDRPPVLNGIASMPGGRF